MLIAESSVTTPWDVSVTEVSSVQAAIHWTHPGLQASTGNPLNQLLGFIWLSLSLSFACRKMVASLVCHVLLARQEVDKNELKTMLLSTDSYERI